MSRRTRLRDTLLNFDIDNYLNRILPGSPIPRLPRPISHFLGYRSEEPSDLPPTLVTIHTAIGIFLGLFCVGAVHNYSPLIKSLHIANVPPSLGAGAILNFCLIQNPTSQPRSTIFGQGISAVVAVSIVKGFNNFGAAHAVGLEWLSAPLAVSLASIAMRLTNTTHPPGGATAILAVTTPALNQLGWYVVPIVMMGASITVAVALIWNNIGRRYPTFWWTPEELPVKKARQRKEEQEEQQRQEEEEQARQEEKEKWSRPRSSGNMNDLERQGSASSSSERTLREGACPCCGRGP